MTIARRTRLSLLVVAGLAACQQEQSAPVITPAPAITSPAAYDAGFPSTFALPSELELLPFERAFDDPDTIVVQSIRVKQPSEASQAIVDGFPEFAISGFGVIGRATGPLRLSLVDARTKTTLLRVPLASSEHPTILLTLQRVVTEETSAIAVYSVHANSLVLEGAYRGTTPDAVYRSEEDDSGLVSETRSAFLRASEASTIIRTWSLNGRFTDTIANRLFENGDLSGIKFAIEGDAGFDQVIGLPLDRWPKAVWMLVLERA